MQLNALVLIAYDIVFQSCRRMAFVENQVGVIKAIRHT
jgi:hypothetical protein